MKKFHGITALLLLLIFNFQSCKKDDNSSSSGSLSTAQLNSSIQQGSWRVTLFQDNGIDETNHYSGYSFTFNSGGSIVASNSGTVNGLWSTGSDDSHIKLILNFGSIVPFSELNSDWHVIQQSATLIRLEDVSGGSGGTDYLTFERN